MMENWGCQGGNTETAYMYIAFNGGVSSSDAYPYTSFYGTTGDCDKTKSTYALSVASYHAVIGEESMKDYVMSTGPLSICIDASDWSTYQGGIVSACGTEVNHCVQVVGIDAENGYWCVPPKPPPPHVAISVPHRPSFRCVFPPQDCPQLLGHHVGRAGLHLPQDGPKHMRDRQRPHVRGGDGVHEERQQELDQEELEEVVEVNGPPWPGHWHIGEARGPRYPRDTALPPPNPPPTPHFPFLEMHILLAIVDKSLDVITPDLAVTWCGCRSRRVLFYHHPSV